MLLLSVLFASHLIFTPFLKVESFLYNEHPFTLFEGGALVKYTFGKSAGIKLNGSIFRTFEKDTLSYRDIFSRIEYYPYSYDKQPVITHYRLFEVRFTEGYMYYQNKEFFVKIGRDTLSWPSRLFLNSRGFPLSFLYYINYRGKRITFSVFNASLLDTVDLKRLAAQLVILNPGKELSIYLGEGVIYTRQNMLKYVNPVAPYYVIQRTSDDGPENLMGLIGIKYKWISFFFLNDDFIIDRGGTSKYGTELEVKIKPFSFIFIRIPRYTYTHYTDTNSWSINGVPIGYQYGPDVLDFYAGFEKNGWNVSGCYLNHGEGRIEEHWEHSGMPKNPPVPSGVVERVRGLKITRSVKESGEIGIFYYNIHNYLNKKNRKEQRIGIYINLFIDKELNLW